MFGRFCEIMPGNDGASQQTAAPRKRCYQPDFPGPFLVIAEAQGEANLSISTMAKRIIQNFGRDYVKAAPISRRKMKILMRTANAANSLLEMDVENVSFMIPQRLIETLGVASIELEVEDEELRDAISFDKGKSIQLFNPDIVEIRRVVKKHGTELTPLTTVIITFSGLTLPTHVEINRALYKVKPYIYPLRQCRNCWRLGHSLKNCRSKKRCHCCLENDISDDHECNQTSPQCVNCGGKHAANDTRQCPKIKRQIEADRDRQNSYSQGPTD